VFDDMSGERDGWRKTMPRAAAAPATAPLALRRCRCYCAVLLLLLPLPGTDTFAFGLAEALEHRLEPGKLRAIIARIAKKTGPRAAR
jgi:hypothetical protein